MLRQCVSVAFLLGCLTGEQAFSQAQPPPLPPMPATQPPIQIIPPYVTNVVVQPTAPLVTPTPQPAVVPPAYRPMPGGVLAWNHETAETTVKFGSINAQTSFAVTNVFNNAVTISHVATSCGCTVPKLPPMPWVLQPGGTGTIDVTMNLAGKAGTVIKTMTVNTDQGFKTLYVKANIEPPPAGQMGEADRMRNLQIAMVNRQAVFQGDCVTCHVTPARGKLGGELYDAACGVCHEAEHRASMVPDLRNLQKETNADYWRTWITTSMEGKLMPAFGIENGGFLSAAEIDSLVQYLTGDFAKGTNAVQRALASPH
jgi:mono/diheme cytochrome c family protein